MRAVTRIHLDHDFVHLAKANEVRRIETTQQGLQVIHRRKHIHAFLRGSFLVYFQHILWKGRVKTRERILDLGNLI